jgi:hypothetical protein
MGILKMDNLRNEFSHRLLIVSSARFLKYSIVSASILMVICFRSFLYMDSVSLLKNHIQPSFCISPILFFFIFCCPPCRKYSFGFYLRPI